MRRKMSKIKEITNDNVIGICKKNNQTSFYNADQEIRTLGSTDNAENAVNLVPGIIRLPSCWDFSICIRDG